MAVLPRQARSSPPVKVIAVIFCLIGTAVCTEDSNSTTAPTTDSTSASAQDRYDDAKDGFDYDVDDSVSQVGSEEGTLVGHYHIKMPGMIHQVDYLADERGYQPTIKYSHSQPRQAKEDEEEDDEEEEEDDGEDHSEEDDRPEVSIMSVSGVLKGSGARADKEGTEKAATQPVTEAPTTPPSVEASSTRPPLSSTRTRFTRERVTRRPLLATTPMFYTTPLGSTIFEVVRDEEPGPEVYMAFESKKFKKKPIGRRPPLKQVFEVNNAITAEKTKEPNLPIQVTTYVADSDSAVSMNLQNLATVTPKTSGSPADTISAFFITSEDDYRAEPTLGVNRYTPSPRPAQSGAPFVYRPTTPQRTDYPEPTTTSKPISVQQEIQSTTLEEQTEVLPTTESVDEDSTKVQVNGNSGYVRRERYTSPASNDQVITVTPLPKSASLLTSSDSVLAPLQAGLSLSHSDGKKEDTMVVEKQVLQAQPVYKTYIEIQKSIPFEIKEIPAEVNQAPPPRHNEQENEYQRIPHPVPVQEGHIEYTTMPQIHQPHTLSQNNLLQQVMLAYQRLSNNVNQVDPQGDQSVQRAPSPLNQNLYYFYRNRYGLQPQQFLYYMPYSNPANNNGNKDYVGNYIMQHSHENTGTEQFLRAPSFPYVFQNPFSIQSPLYLDHYPIPFVHNNIYNQQKEEPAGPGVNKYVIHHHPGATSGAYFKIEEEGGDNALEGSDSEAVVGQDEKNKDNTGKEEDNNPQPSVGLEKPVSVPRPYHDKTPQFSTSKYLDKLVPYPHPYGNAPPQGPQFYVPGKQVGGRVPFRPSQTMYSSQYPPPQTYRFVSTVMRGRGMRSIRGKKLCIEYGGFKPPLVPSVQIDEKFLENATAEEKSDKEE